MLIPIAVLLLIFTCFSTIPDSKPLKALSESTPNERDRLVQAQAEFEVNYRSFKEQTTKEIANLQSEYQALKNNHEKLAGVVSAQLNRPTVPGGIAQFSSIKEQFKLLEDLQHRFPTGFAIYGVRGKGVLTSLSETFLGPVYRSSLLSCLVTPTWENGQIVSFQVHYDATRENSVLLMDFNVRTGATVNESYGLMKIDENVLELVPLAVDPENVLVAIGLRPPTAAEYRRGLMMRLELYRNGTPEYRRDLEKRYPELRALAQEKYPELRKQ